MDKYKTFNPKELELKETHQLLLASVAPRPIGFTASKDVEGNINLAPFSYHNAFSSNPPVVGISPAFSGKTGKPKNTLSNIIATKEFTLSIVTYNMVEQMNICAADYAPGIDEFEKSGLNKYASHSISVPGVAESPLILECKFLQHIELSDKPAGGNLLLGEIVYFHAREDIYNEFGQIDPQKVDQVSRMGKNWYSRANQGLFELPAPKFLPMGVDQLPKEIKKSSYFSGKMLARLAYVESIPISNISDIMKKKFGDADKDVLLKECANFLQNNQIEEAWQILHLSSII